MSVEGVGPAYGISAGGRGDQIGTRPTAPQVIFHAAAPDLVERCIHELQNQIFVQTIHSHARPFVRAGGRD